MSTDITTTHEWKDLEAHQAEISETNLRELFADDPERANPVSYTHLTLPTICSV